MINIAYKQKPPFGAKLDKNSSPGLTLFNAFNELGGTKVFDLTGNVRNGEFDSTTPPYWKNNGIEFDAQLKHINLFDDTILPGTGTIMCAYQRVGTPTNFFYWMAQDSYVNFNLRANNLLTTNNAFEINNSEQQFTDAATFGDGNLRILTLMWNEVDGTMYNRVDLRTPNTDAVGGFTIQRPGGKFNLGCRTGTTDRYAAGNFKWFKMWSRNLSESEIKSQFHNPWQDVEPRKFYLNGVATTGDVTGTVNALVNINSSNIINQSYSAQLAGSVSILSSLSFNNANKSSYSGYVNVEASMSIQSINRALLNSVVNVEALNSVQQKYLAIVGGTVNVNALLNLSQGNSFTFGGSVSVEALNTINQVYSAVIGGSVDVEAAYNIFVSSLNELSVGGLVTVEASNNINQKYDLITSAYVNVESSNTFGNADRLTFGGLVTVSALNSIQVVNRAIVGGLVNVESVNNLFYRISASVNSAISIEALLSLFSDINLEATIGAFVNVNAQVSGTSILVSPLSLVTGGYVYVKSHLTEREDIVAIFGYQKQQIKSTSGNRILYPQRIFPLVEMNKEDVSFTNIIISQKDISSINTVTLEVYSCTPTSISVDPVNSNWITTSLNIATAELVNYTLTTKYGEHDLRVNFDPSSLSAEDLNRYYFIKVLVNSDDDASIQQAYIELIMQILNY